MATIIKTTGEETQVPRPDLEGMQAIVGGYIEFVYLDDGRALVVDEEGRLNNKPVNAKASALLGADHLPIVGDAVLLTYEESADA